MGNGVNRIAHKAGEVNVLALVKGEEQYIWAYRDEHKTDMLRSFGRFASDPQLSLTWYDAAALSQKVREK